MRGAPLSSKMLPSKLLDRTIFADLQQPQQLGRLFYHFSGHAVPKGDPSSSTLLQSASLQSATLQSAALIASIASIAPQLISIAKEGGLISIAYSLALAE